jgi:Protein of unknown function (DUF1194)
VTKALSFSWVLVLCGLLFPAAAFAEGGQPVDVALVLAVDASGSIDSEEYQMQHEGYATAFSDDAVIEAIQSGETQAIAVTFVEWSGFGHQRQLVPWTVIKDADSAHAFADRIRAAPRAFSDWTSISDALDFSAALFKDNGFEPIRSVIDVSGDGVNNNGRPVIAARDDAVAQGITINGLPILNEDPSLDAYYQENVVGGPGAFKIPVENFQSFSQAILGKLVREIATLPRPITLASLAH